MKKQIFYIHGGESYENIQDFYKRLSTKDIWDLPSKRDFLKWTKTLADDLGDGYEVFMPQMPNAQNAKYDEWKLWFERHFEHLRDDVVLVGCSLGAMFLLKYFSEEVTPFSVKALFILAGATSGLTLNVTDCGDFVANKSHLKKIPGKVGVIKILHSKDDFLVPYEHSVELQRHIPDSVLMLFEDKNHFLIEEFPEFVEEMKRLG